MHISGASITKVQDLFQSVLASTAQIDDLLRAEAYSPQTANSIIELASGASRQAQTGQRLIGQAMRTDHGWITLPNKSYLCTNLQKAKASAHAVSQSLAETAAQVRSGDWAQKSTLREISTRAQHVIESLEMERILHNA